jgi:hypothetical protein
VNVTDSRRMLCEAGLRCHNFHSGISFLLNLFLGNEEIELRSHRDHGDV